MPNSAKVFVYVHPSTTHLRCSSVGIKVWDSFATIFTSTSTLPTSSPFDLGPFHFDNKALCADRPEDEKLTSVVNGTVQADDARKYTWLVSHSFVDWVEETWVTRLFHCIKEHEEELGIQVVNISQREPMWESWLRTVFFFVRTSYLMHNI